MQDIWNAYKARTTRKFNRNLSSQPLFFSLKGGKKTVTEPLLSPAHHKLSLEVTPLLERAINQGRAGRLTSIELKEVQKKITRNQAAAERVKGAMNLVFQKLASAEEVENYAKRQEQILSDEAGKIREG